MNDALTLGIDPGLHGAVALLDDHGICVAVREFPVSFDGAISWIDGSALYDMLGEMLAAVPQRRKQHVNAWIERVGAMPMQGRTSIFTFGCAFGSVLAVLQCHRCSIEFVTPPKWKAAYGLTRQPKDASVAKAKLLYPGVPFLDDVDKAEAVLIARYGRRQLVEGGPARPVKLVAAEETDANMA